MGRHLDSTQLPSYLPSLAPRRPLHIYQVWDGCSQVHSSLLHPEGSIPSVRRINGGCARSLSQLQVSLTCAPWSPPKRAGCAGCTCGGSNGGPSTEVWKFQAALINCSRPLDPNIVSAGGVWARLSYLSYRVYWQRYCEAPILHTHTHTPTMATHAAKPFKTGLKQIFLYVAVRLGDGNDITSLTRR